MNYTELSAAIQGYAENEFPTTAGSFTSTDQIDTFIQQAEQRIYNTVQFPLLRKNVTGTTSADNKYLSAPSDFLAVYSFAVIDGDGVYEFMLNKDVNFIRAAFPSPTDTDIPQYYALFGPTTTSGTPPVITAEISFILGPTPDDAYDVELHYYYYPESIVTASTTWLGDNFDSVLLYGSLMEAFTFMRADADTIGNYQKRYDDALALAKRLGDGMERTDSFRSGQARYPVK